MDFKKDPKTKFKDVKKLSKKEAKEQAEVLREGINYHDYLYYVKNKPRISDAKYDKLFKRLEELEEAYPDLKKENSPTRRVGAEPVDELKKVKHRSSMLSLEAALEEKQVKDFHNSVKKKISGKVIYLAEPKFDGLSVELVYKGGRFETGSTRGDGRKGEDITRNLMTIGSVLPELQGSGEAPELLSVRGEVLMRKDGFQKLNKQRIENGQDPFANPRNAAAGLMRQLDPKKVAGKPMDLFVYEVMECKGEDFDSHLKTLEKLQKWGLKVNSQNSKCTSFFDIKKYHGKMEKNRDKLDYEIDGVVIKVDDMEKRRKLGTRERNPKWALAWKFSPREEATTLEDIVVQVGASGMLTPVALLQPVDVGGVTISRATLHNADEVREKDVRPGDKVKVQRAGDVIPEVVKRIKRSGKKRGKKFHMPKKCPSCGSKVLRQGAYYFCPAGLSCKAQLAGRIIHFASREAMDIENLGEETIKNLVDRGMVSDMADLYKLKKKDIKKLEGFADKSAGKLKKSIQHSKKARLDTFLYALGIHHVGGHIARVLSEKYGTLEKLKKADLKDLKKTPEVGDEIAESVKEFFSREENLKTLKRLKRAGLEIKKMPKKKKKKSFRDKTFVFTGELDDFTRDEAKGVVEDLGGRATSSVSDNTDYVVVGEDPGSKLEEAQKRKIKTIDEKKFKKMVRS
ncbi:MAG: NAD-dependent DNA ligase LigA [Candidatus Omnitrophica bacterium]|nr:NAD-dependent DNA ligase LigA [Candidatus Omnitrophota bacterium]